MKKQDAPKTYKIYWIYDAAKHTDPWKEGYVGCTTQAVCKRYGHHKHQQFSGISGTKYKSPRHMYKFIQSAKDPQYEELCRTTSRKHATDLEYHYRPVSDIGENKYPGGYYVGEQKSIYAIDPEGNRYDYESMGDAVRDGFSLGGVHDSLKKEHMRSTSKIRGKCKFYYA